MNPNLLIYPMFSMVVLTFVVGAMALRARVRAVKSGEISFKYFRTNNGESAPEHMVKRDRHFSNLFEAPTLYYAGCLAAMVTQTVSTTSLFFAWAYVVARLAHAYIHIGPNKVIYRMRAYLASWIMLLGLWITVVISISL